MLRRGHSNSPADRYQGVVTISWKNKLLTEEGVSVHFLLLLFAFKYHVESSHNIFKKIAKSLYLLPHNLLKSI